TRGHCLCSGSPAPEQCMSQSPSYAEPFGRMHASSAMRSPFAFLFLTTPVPAVCEIGQRHPSVSNKSAAFSHVAACGVFRCMAHEKLPVPLPFEEVLQRHEREILRYLLRVAGDHEEAADLFQETWLRAYRAYPRLHPDSDVRPWLYAIATNLCRNHARNGARRARVIVSDSEMRAAADTTGGHRQSFYETDGYAMVPIRKLPAHLPIKQRQAVYLRYIGGLAYAEIAAIMNCSQESARANVSQAVRKLKAAGCEQ